MRTVSLITDLGLKDHYLALLKTMILKESPDVNFVDVSHGISTHDIQEAAYFLKSVIKHFPPGSIHLLSVYNYYAPDPEFIVFEYEGHFFVGPNNGIFSLVFEDLDEAHIHKITFESNSRLSSFEYLAHGVSALANGMKVSHIGLTVENFERKLGIRPVITNSEIRATIIYVDQFDNVVLNVTREFFEMQRRDRSFKLFFQNTNPITTIRKSYSDVAIGEVSCFFNHAGYMEIAINMGRASSMLDLHKNETVQIYFEEA